MRTLKSAGRLAIATALLATSFVAISASPAMAAGCNAGYTNSYTYRAGACTGYPSNFKVRASAKCNGATRYGAWVFVAGYSYARCTAGQVITAGAYQVSP
jgi:hypothetical protein